MSLTHLKSTDQLFCRMTFNLALSDTFSCLQDDDAFLAGNCRSDDVSFSASSHQALNVSTTSDDGVFDHLIKVVSGFSTVRL